MDSQTSKRRGFAGMDQRKQREIASKGGQAAHQKGTAHEFSSEEARAAGRKGGETVSANRAHMSAIGRKGGESSHSGAQRSGNGGMPNRENGGASNGYDGDGHDDRLKPGEAIVSSSDRGNEAPRNEDDQTKDQRGDRQDETNRYGNRSD